MDDSSFRRSGNIEDRRKQKLIPGVFGNADPDVYGAPSDWSGLGSPEWLKDAPPVQNTPLGRQLGLDSLERDQLKSEQDAAVRDALEAGSVEDPNQPFNANGPPVRISRQSNANPAPFMDNQLNVQSAIADAARAHGIDPATALAIAERESRFDPNARASKTIRGIFQMTGGLRRQYGVGDSPDPAVQAQGWAKFYKDNKAEMGKILGRDVSDVEAYSGHHFGGTRAARMMQMDPTTPVSSVFTRNEMAQNPHFAKAGTVGNLLASVTGDIKTRSAKFGGDAPDFSEFGQPVQEAGPAQLPDFSKMGTPAETLPTAAPDFSKLGQSVG